MKYKSEIVYQGQVKAEFYFNDLSHPNQAVRNVVNKTKGKLNYFIIYVINDAGDSWRFSVMKQPSGKLLVRNMEKIRKIYTRDDLDMIFTGNKHIAG